MNPLKFLRQLVCPGRTVGTIGERLLALIADVIENVCEDNIVERNMTALAKRYGKPSVSDLFFDKNLTPDEILVRLKKDTRIYL